MKYYPIHMHLHCSHESSASIHSHMSYAKSLGIDHIWTTEHDTRISKPAGRYFHFFFPEKALYITLPSGKTAGFKEEENGGSYSFKEENGEISLRAFSKKGEREALYFQSQGKRHSDPLFSRVTVEISGDINVKDCGRATVEFILSAQPPTYNQARLCYVSGDIPAADGSPTQYLPLPEKKDGKYIFELYKDVSEDIGGADNALCNIRLIMENGAEITLKDIGFYRELEYEKTRSAQKELVEKIGKIYGVKAFVGFEVTGAGNHKNCFSTKTPVIEYAKFDNKVSNEQAIEHLQKYGATYSWNHPFTKYVKSGKSREEIFEIVANDLIENRVYGAKLIETGFPAGRDIFEAKDFLRLWDELSAAGIMITGYGDSDNHHAVEDCWTTGNNFCGFAGIEGEPTEENFVKAFNCGNLWSGNPVVIRDLSFTAGDKPQGSLIRGESVEVEFSAKGIKCGGYAICISNGEETARLPIKGGQVSGKWLLKAENDFNFARVEIYNEEDTLIAFSNPIYLARESAEVKER